MYVTIGTTIFPVVSYVGLDESEPRALEDDQVYFTFDPEELISVHEAGVLSLVSQSDEQISTPDNKFTGRVVDVGVGGDGNVGMYLIRTGPAEDEADGEDSEEKHTRSER